MSLIKDAKKSEFRIKFRTFEEQLKILSLKAFRNLKKAKFDLSTGPG